MSNNKEERGACTFDSIDTMDYLLENYRQASKNILHLRRLTMLVLIAANDLGVPRIQPYRPAPRGAWTTPAPRQLIRGRNSSNTSLIRDPSLKLSPRKPDLGPTAP